MKIAPPFYETSLIRSFYQKIYQVVQPN